MSLTKIIGTDGQAPVATSGYSINHFALVVTDMVAIQHFYGTVLGLRHIVTYNITPTYQVTYTGYPTDQSGFQTGEEMLRDLRHRDGLIEFLHTTSRAAAQKADVVSNTTKKTQGFSHLGIVVPAVQAAERRMIDFAVPILKPLGVQKLEPGSEISRQWGLDQFQAAEARAGTRALRFEDVLLVADPEGNVVEIMQRE